MRLRENKKFLVGFVLPFIIMLLAGCGGEATNTSAPATTAPATTAATTAPAATATKIATTAATTTAAAPTAVEVGNKTGGLTMKEAYALAEPQMKAWQEDRVLFSIFNTLDSGIGINPDGKSAQWNFQVVSPKVNKRATFLVKADKDGKVAYVSKTGEETLSAAEAKASPALPPVTSLIDSSQLMSVAKQNGGDKSDSPVGFFLRQPIKEGEPLAVDLVFYKGNDVVRLRIDMQSGKIVQNDKG